MKTVDQAIVENGSFEKDGEFFVLLGQAVPKNIGTDNDYGYTATAKKNSEWDDDDASRYRVWWDVLDDFDAENDSDESNACDWSNPISIEMCD